MGDAPANALADAAQPAAHREKSADPNGPDAFGLSLTDATPQLRQQHGIAADLPGAFITAVAPGSLAEVLGLRPGELVLEVQGKAVKDAAEARSLIARLNPADGMRLRVRRGDMSRFVYLKLSP